MYSSVKDAMRAANYPASTGDNWTATDAAQFRDFANFELGIDHAKAADVLAHPENYADQLNAYAKRLQVSASAPSAALEAETIDEPASQNSDEATPQADQLIANDQTAQDAPPAIESQPQAQDPALTGNSEANAQPSTDQSSDEQTSSEDITEDQSGNQ